LVGAEWSPVLSTTAGDQTSNQETSAMSAADESLPSINDETFDELLSRRLGRRDVMKIGLVATMATVVGGRLSATPAAAQSAGTAARGSAPFEPIPAWHVADDWMHLPPGYTYDVLARWGDPLFDGAPEFDVNRQSAVSQALQVGFNHDFQEFFPTGANSGVLFINHEYTTGQTMFPGYDPRTSDTAKLKAWVDIELQAHGATIVELERADGSSPWKVFMGSRNRRITATTPMRLSGPAAGDQRVRGQVLGMLNNCGGGATPWGTVLTAEENFNQYFANASKVGDATLRAHHTRYGVLNAASDRGWEKIYPERFDLDFVPNEPFKYGWLVEIDPMDPSSTPIKRTALGRFKHEAGTTILAADRRVVVYSGDDERNDYMYKFVTNDAYRTTMSKTQAGALLDEGTLYVAKFAADGTGSWLPLVQGRPGLTATEGFVNQADICLRTRQAADSLRATRMDRPEDIEANPKTGKVYVALTNNSRRTALSTDAGEAAANPRLSASAGNRYGHIIELTEAGNDNGATSFRWEVFMLAGDPARGARVDNPLRAGANDVYFAGYKGDVSIVGAPDNVAFDTDGNLWIATDGSPSATGYNDGLHCVPVNGPDRGAVKQFMTVPAGAECCGPVFTADGTALFVAVQHPGEDAGFAAGGYFVPGDPTTNSQSAWPDGPGNVPRPATVVIRKVGGGKLL
jgi:uncharacterized protein